MFIDIELKSIDIFPVEVCCTVSNLRRADVVFYGLSLLCAAVNDCPGAKVFE